jgi:hypothetical protein
VAIFVKDPAATIDYGIDWSTEYLVGQTITVSDWQVTPGGVGAVSIEAHSITPAGTAATLAGGVPGCLYHVTNTVTFSNSRTDQRMLALRVEDR